CRTDRAKSSLSLIQKFLLDEKLKHLSDDSRLVLNELDRDRLSLIQQFLLVDPYSTEALKLIEDHSASVGPVAESCRHLKAGALAWRGRRHRDRGGGPLSL